jgi:PAS domain S-box-containing protein
MNPSIPATITEDCLSGYHRFCLEKPYHLDYASPNLCSILGYTSEEIHDLFHDKYSRIVHEKDRARFLHYIEQLASKEQTLTLQYRMVCKDGHIILLHDTMTSRRLDDGRMYGFAVLADITDSHDVCASDSMGIVPEQFLGAYGFLKFTCERYPKITHINQYMRDYLGITNENSSWYDLLKENIYFLIPFEERDMFHDHLEEALHSKSPIRIEHQLLRSNESRITLTGWLSVQEDEYGNKEYVLTYTPMENKHMEIESIRNNAYFHALENAYSVIFEVNLANSTVECIGGRKASAIGPLYDVHMTVESAKNFWLNHYIVEEDREMTKDFFDRITNLRGWKDSRMFHLKFRLKWTDNLIHTLISFAVKLDESTILVCCQDMTNILISNKEQIALNKLCRWIDYDLTHTKNALGMMLLEKSSNSYSLTFASANIRRYLGYDQDTYLRYVSGELPLSELLTASYLSYDDFEALLNSGHLSLHLREQNGTVEQQALLTSTPYEYDHMTLYEITVYSSIPSADSDASQAKIFARTFGHFDLFVNNLPVTFSSEKEKELMALLIDRNGGTLSPSEAISYLWEDVEPTEKVASRYRKLAMSLKNTLEKYGIGHILLNNHGVRSVDVSAIKCDYYELLAGNEKYKNTFHNSYMTNYSWAEETLATLWDYS